MMLLIVGAFLGLVGFAIGGMTVAIMSSKRVHDGYDLTMDNGEVKWLKR